MTIEGERGFFGGFVNSINSPYNTDSMNWIEHLIYVQLY